MVLGGVGGGLRGNLGVPVGPGGGPKVFWGFYEGPKGSWGVICGVPKGIWRWLRGI